MSSEKTLPEEEPTVAPGWPEMSPEQEAELEAAFSQAEEDMKNGVPGIPMDEVLPRRYRQTG